MARLADGGTETSLIALGELDADALLGRRQDAAVQHALGLVERANILVASTPVYRATYTGLLKVFFDLFPPTCARGKGRVRHRHWGLGRTPSSRGSGPAPALRERERRGRSRRIRH
jgi:NAD(P)H-dependent FMN reductase